MTKLGAGNASGDLIVFDGTSWIVLGVNATATRKYLKSVSGVTSLATLLPGDVVPNYSVTLPTNPTGTTSTSLVHDGLAVYFTPANTGRVRIIVALTLTNTVAADYTYGQLVYGTGTAPINGAAQTGTVVGIQDVLGSLGANNWYAGLTFVNVVSGLTVSTQYWFDLVQRVNAGTGQHLNIQYYLEEF